MAEPRNLFHVIDLVLQQIPKEGEWTDLRRSLEEKKEQARLPYTAPEGMAVLWNEVSRILLREVGRSLDAPWKEQIDAIMRGRNY